VAHMGRNARFSQGGAEALNKGEGRDTKSANAIAMKKRIGGGPERRSFLI
jgi:hypothetical protein